MTAEQYRLFESAATPLMFVITIDSYLKGDVITKYDHCGMHHWTEFRIPEIINEMLDEINFPDDGKQASRKFITRYEHSFELAGRTQSWRHIDEAVKNKRGELCTFEFIIDSRWKRQISGLLRWKDVVIGINGIADPVYEIESSDHLQLVVSKIAQHLQREKNKEKDRQRMLDVMKKKMEERKKYSFTIDGGDSLADTEAEENLETI